MPIKLINAIPINPVMIYVIPRPLRGAGTLEYLIFSLMAAKPTIAKKKPNPDPNPNTVASVIFEYARSCINKDEPKIAQLTAIKGKNKPKDPYKAGENFSISISTN